MPKAASEKIASRRLRPKVVQIDGVSVKVFSVGVLADRLEVSDATVVHWLRGEVIPEVTHTDKFGRRWFSEDYIVGMAVCHADRAEQEDQSLETFAAQLQEHFEEEGIQ